MTVQLRNNTKYTLIHKFRQWIQSSRGVQLGSKVWIDKNVALMRFPDNISVGDNVMLKEGVKICSCNQNSKVNIGNNTTIGYYSFMFASAGISVGSDCMIAPFVYLVDSNHRTNKGLLLNQQPNESSPIEIGNDVWIASNVTVLKGVTIADGAIIAAQSLVNCSVGPNEIWAGTPAKKIGVRE